MEEGSYISALELFAREAAFREFPGQNPEEIIASLASGFPPSADFSGEKAKLDAIAKILLEELASGNSAGGAIAIFVLDDNSPGLQGTAGPVTWMVFFVGVILALRLSTIEVDDNVRIAFDNSNTKAIVEMLVEVLPDAITATTEAIGTARQRMQQIDGH